ncbi:alpha-D-ribose 1-methylphosphonate 5-triphosphate diphosphatase [Roseomonas terrae]|jgi:alpha-D-ribose 1-methylphosphonate 5-triphosphate diphosphatase|uniref:Alpha-D-ribose 1-methylphosphonate 5-triphosphate diphosphatase n=1 Tax=Neoroseomonas terrae TaxID=424799 RepID=A0ABS5EKM5_9PROT|nr:alpha-D-ribose 1-methylphosphonate 5-triphosphate diphosphatase [Neoroseomonas terrae]MBR0651581.1 alpha-D-ribose 1-methylphosphonate 5-triphosphate diphosphatase [Neoroseomonas terrae]
MDWILSGGAVLRDGAMAEGVLALSDGVVAETAAPAASRFDATGLLVMPGLVDIHGDAHERQLQPRPGVDLPVSLALRDSAAQLIACGITTAYLGVTLSWEPGLRSLAAWRALKAALPAAREDSATDLRVHLRFEADNFDALDDALAGIADGSVHLLGFNDHTMAIVKKLDDAVQTAKYAGRAGVKTETFRALAESAAARRGEIPAARMRLADAARAAGIPMLSHDDATLDDRALFRGVGATICEFPMAEAVAADAREAGEPVVMGAPNVVRGGSHLGWASAAPLAERGLVTVLASDYVWPAMMEAAFAMATRGVLDLPRAWALVSANPAEACGLTDRGRLDPGLRGDVVAVDPDRRAPAAVFAAGRLAWLAPGAAGRLRRA